MRMMAFAIALAVVAAVGYGVTQREEWGRQQHAAAPAPAQKAPPAPFAAADRGGYTPGDDVTRYMALGTPTAAFDAWSLIDSCERAERHGLFDAAERCNGITQKHRRKAGELLASTARPWRTRKSSSTSRARKLPRGAATTPTSTRQ